jgi:UDP-glucose 4-epimerase
VRVLVTGMGGELGTRVAMLLEAHRDVEAVAGIDVEPPRRHLRRAEFHRIDPRDRVRVVRTVRDLAPTAVVHLGVYEPHARTSPRRAEERTLAGTDTLLATLTGLGGVERLVVRSGVEVYGRRRGRPLVPDESVLPEPTTAFGHTLAAVETMATARRGDASLALLRLGPVVGPHAPSPLGRYLRLPVVGLDALADPPFSVLHQEDAARAIVHALSAGADGTWNVVGPGAVTPLQAVRLGSRLPVPVAPPAWPLVRRAAELAGAPLPDHVTELLRRGRSADGTRIHEELAFDPAYSTTDVVKDLYEWAPVAHLRAVRGAA